MRIFLVGEGPTDIGDLSKLLQYRSEPPADGFLQPLIRTMVQGDCEITGQKITALRPTKVRGVKTAVKSKAQMAAAIAELEGADLLVYSMDGDNDFTARRTSLVSKLDATRVAFAVAMPKATIESWALGDEQALRTLDASLSAPNHPERLWGKPHDPSSNHPKHVLAGMIGRTPDRDSLARVGAEARPSALCGKCPESFRPFSDEMSAATGHLPCTP